MAKSNAARKTKIKMEVVEETPSVSLLMQEYQKLNDQCDTILAQINQRKQLKEK